MKIKIKLTIITYLIINFVNAVQNIEIVGGSTSGPKIDIVNFINDPQSEMSSVVANDLKITGEFNVSLLLDEKEMKDVPQYVVTGSVLPSSINCKLSSREINGQSTVLFDKNYLYESLVNKRKAMHSCSNDIYEKITGNHGSFTSKIAFILKNNNKYSIVVSDYDGYNQKTILSTVHPIISLAWSPDAKQISYTSFESNKPTVYVQDLYNSNRYLESNFKGSNSSSVFTNDDKNILLTLTKDGGSHIYMLPKQKFFSGETAKSLINFGTIDTEASISKEGKIVFTSDHDGGPQIFMTSIDGGTPVRLTLQNGNYNTSAKLSHDGKKMVFVNRTDARQLEAYIMDLATKTSYQISFKTTMDLSPSFSPNDKLVLFSSNGEMYIVNTLGTIQTEVSNIKGDIIDQSWSPVN